VIFRIFTPDELYRVGIDSAMRRKCWPAVVAFSRARGRLTSVQQETKAELVINRKRSASKCRPTLLALPTR